MKRITTIQQANRHQRAGDTLLCSYSGVELAKVTHIRYSQQSFQVKVVGSDEWVTPFRVWAETNITQEPDIPTLWGTDIPAIEKMPPVNPCVQVYGPGPEGKQCQDCRYLVGFCKGQVYYKCLLRRLTNSPASDHRVRWPACAKFEQRKSDHIQLYDGRG